MNRVYYTILTPQTIRWSVIYDYRRRAEARQVPGAKELGDLIFTFDRCYFAWNFKIKVMCKCKNRVILNLRKTSGELIFLSYRPRHTLRASTITNQPAIWEAIETIRDIKLTSQPPLADYV